MALVALGGCSGGGAGGRLSVHLVGDGSFDRAQVARLVLGVDGDGPRRVNLEVPIAAGAGLPAAGLSADYQRTGANAVVVSAVALDASGARLGSGLAAPVGPGAAEADVTLSASGRLDGGTVVLPDLSL